MARSVALEGLLGCRRLGRCGLDKCVSQRVLRYLEGAV